MNNSINKLNKEEQFQQDLQAAVDRYNHRALSDNAKRAWEKRKMLSLMAMLLCKA